MDSARRKNRQSRSDRAQRGDREKFCDRGAERHFRQHARGRARNDGGTGWHYRPYRTWRRHRNWRSSRDRQEYPGWNLVGLSRGSAPRSKTTDCLDPPTRKTLRAGQRDREKTWALSSTRTRKEPAQSFSRNPFCAAGQHGLRFHRIRGGDQQLKLLRVFARQPFDDRVGRLSTARIKNLHIFWLRYRLDLCSLAIENDHHADPSPILIIA